MLNYKISHPKKTLWIYMHVYMYESERECELGVRPKRASRISNSKIPLILSSQVYNMASREFWSQGDLRNTLTDILIYRRIWDSQREDSTLRSQITERQQQTSIPKAGPVACLLGLNYFSPIEDHSSNYLIFLGSKKKKKKSKNYKGIQG